MKKMLCAALAAIALFSIPITSIAATPNYYGNLIGGTVSGSTGTFSGAVSVSGNLSTAGTLDAGAVTSHSGVAVGGALTGATSGNFSGAVSVGSLTSGSGVVVNGTLTAASTGSFSGNVAALSVSTAATGLVMTNAAASCTTQVGTGGGAVAGVTAQAIYVYVPCLGQLAAMDDVGNLGIAGSLFTAAGIFTGGGQLPPVYTTSGAALGSGTVHIVVGSISQSSTTVAVNLSGAASFTNCSSYYVADSLDSAGGSNTAASYATCVNGSQFTLTNPGAFGVVHFIAVGF